MLVPITVVTGFLGSGKTTVINNVIKQVDNSDEKISIIVNEFGEVGVDHDLLQTSSEKIIQLNNGCVCCNLREDLVSCLREIMKHPSAQVLEAIVIETTGVADPLPIIRAIQTSPYLRPIVRLDSVISVVDGVNVMKNSEEVPEVRQQLAYADRFILTKSEQLETAKKQELLDHLSKVNPLADVRYFSKDKSFLTSDFFNLELFDAVKEIEGLVSEGHINNHTNFCSCHSCNEHGQNEFESVVLTTPNYIPENKLVRWLDEVVLYFEGALYRYKGLIRIEDRELMGALQGVVTHYELNLTSQLAEDSLTKLVFIGKSLDKKYLEDSFKKVTN